MKQKSAKSAPTPAKSSATPTRPALPASTPAAAAPKSVKTLALSPALRQAWSDAPFPYQQYWFPGLLAFYFVTRLILLLLSRRYLMSDEAVVGVMATDILHGKPIPFFLYNQDYGGGHVVEALLMIPWFKLFGPSDLIVKSVPVAVGALHLAVVYAVVYRFFSRRPALAGMAVYACCCTFVASNFLVSGGMATWFFAWLGVYFFFCHFYGDKPRLSHLTLAGMALGFAFYCYNYALFYIMAVAGLLLYRHRLGLWRQWKALAVLGGGMILGAWPLIIYNFRNHFRGLRMMLRTGEGGHSSLGALFVHLRGLLAHDLPGVFQTDINSFALRITWQSWLAAFVFYGALAWFIFVMRRPILRALRGLGRGTPPAAAREERVLALLYFFVLYGLIYCISGFAGASPRYVLNFFPVLPVLFAWSVMHLAQRWLKCAVLATTLFLAPQFWLVAQMAQDKTTTEWNITLHGEDIKQVVRFLEDHHLRNVLGPYEVKWKLMFYSQRRLSCAASLFGFDREDEESLMVLKRINEQREPWAMVLDRKLELANVAWNFNPEGAFKPGEFFGFLKRNDIHFDATEVGDYVVFHNFSKFFQVTPNFAGLEKLQDEK